MARLALPLIHKNIFTPLEDGRARIDWSEPQRAISIGQICALYDGETLLGGGIYSEVDLG